MKKLLVLNGSHSDVPLIQAGKKLGYRVITSGNDPHLVGHRLSDEHHCVDFSDRQAILDLARNIGIDAVCACANDFGAITAAYVAEEMRLPGHDPYSTALTLHQKHRFKEMALACGITTPRAVHFSSPEDALGAMEALRFPLMVKPVDLTGGKGVSKANSRFELEHAACHAHACSRIGEFVVEEFIEGTYHSFSSFVVNGRIAFSFSDNEYSFNDPFLVSTSAGPATGIELVRGQLEAESEQIVAHLSLCDGVFHIQYIQSGSKAWIIEIVRRCSGDFYPIPVSLATGLDWAEWIVKAECGIGCGDFPPDAVQRGFFGRHCVVAPANGVLESIVVARELEANVVGRFDVLEPGGVVEDFRAQKLAVLFLGYTDAGEMMEKTIRMKDLVRTVIR